MPNIMPWSWRRNTVCTPPIIGDYQWTTHDKSHSTITNWERPLHMMTSSNGNIFRVTGPLCGEFTGPGEIPAQRPVTRSFDVFFDVRPNKRLSKQPWGWWFKTSSWSLWRQWIDFLHAMSFLSDLPRHWIAHLFMTGVSAILLPYDIVNKYRLKRKERIKVARRYFIEWKVFYVKISCRKCFL